MKNLKSSRAKILLKVKFDASHFESQVACYITVTMLPTNPSTPFGNFLSLHRHNANRFRLILQRLFNSINNGSIDRCGGWKGSDLKNLETALNSLPPPTHLAPNAVSMFAAQTSSFAQSEINDFIYVAIWRWERGSGNDIRQIESTPFVVPPSPASSLHLLKNPSEANWASRQFYLDFPWASSMIRRWRNGKAPRLVSPIPHFRFFSEMRNEKFNRF